MLNRLLKKGSVGRRFLGRPTSPLSGSGAHPKLDTFAHYSYAN